MAYAIDTHAGVKELEQSGVPDKQAEAIVKLITQQDEGLAIKGDIAALEGKFEAIIMALEGRIEARVDRKIAEAKITLLLALIAAVGIIIASVGVLIRVLL